MIIGFSSTTNILSRIIMWATHSKASHSFLIFEVADEPIIIQSSIHGVECMNYYRFLEGHKIVAKYKLSDKLEEQEALSASIKLLNSPYDFLSVFGFGWVLFCKMFGKKVKNPFPNRNAYQCSEFVLTVLKAAGLNGKLKDLDPELTSPEDLIECLNQSQDVEKF